MKKTLVFLYGVIAYLVFLVAFLYAVGFVGNYLVPKSIDTGTSTSVTRALLVDAILLSIFALQHSIMARPAFKKWWTGIISPVIERSTYVLLSSLALLLLYWQWQPMPSLIWKVESATWTLVLQAMYAMGWLIVFLSTFMINHFDLFGLKQVFQYMRSQEPAPQNFTAKLFYGIVRHPIMLGFLIAFWSTPVMTMGHLVFAATTTVYILIAVKFLEERDLKKALGEQYTNYQKKVPMIIPFMKK
jgi:protein-S-isoprenylcysteine O-methyltransferase Ste14